MTGSGCGLKIQLTGQLDGEGLVSYSIVDVGVWYDWHDSASALVVPYVLRTQGRELQSGLVFAPRDSNIVEANPVPRHTSWNWVVMRIQDAGVGL